MKKRTLALLLIMALCISLLAGCGNSEQVAPSGQNDDDSSTGVDAAQTAVVEDEEEMAEINIALMCLAALDRAATQPVEDAVNAITEPELNIHVTINWYDAASYGTQVPMQIQAAEKLDLIMFTPVPSASYSSFRNSNQLMDITDLLHQYGQTILATEGDLIGATSFGGSIYGIPSHYNLAGGAQVFVRRDLAEEYGVAEALENAKTWTEIHDAFMTITAGTGMPALANIDDKGTVMYLSPYFMASDDLSEAYSYDNLGDGYRMIIVDPDTNQIKNVFATDEYRETIARTRAWYEDGLIYKDAATAQVYGSSQVRADVCYAVVNAGSLGSEQTFASNTGYDPIIINLADTTLGSVTVSKFGYAVPVTATEPAAAVRFVNYLYESSEMMNLLTWGIEGRDWVLNENGQATYPEGVAAESVPYHTADFLYGDQNLITPWEGAQPNIRELQREAMANAPTSKYMSFALDTEGLENIITACSAVKDRYFPTLHSGNSAAWEKTLDQFLADLEAAGINELIAAYQAQLDAWIAANS